MRFAQGAVVGSLVTHRSAASGAGQEPPSRQMRMGMVGARGRPAAAGCAGRPGRRSRYTEACGSAQGWSRLMILRVLAISTSVVLRIQSAIARNSASLYLAAI